VRRSPDLPSPQRAQPGPPGSTRSADLLPPPWFEGWPRRALDGDLAPESRPGGWPRVSLVTPTLNQAPYLEDTLLSVLHQGYPSLEYLVFDGGSTDGALEILRRYGDRLTHWETGPDRGQSDAVNKGWQRSTGKYLWWLNGDDMLAPGALADAVRFLEDNPQVDLVFGDLLRIDERGQAVEIHRVPDFDLAAYVLDGHHVSQAGALMRREVLDRIGTLDVDLHYLMDTDYWHRLALAGGRIAHIPQVLALFRVHAESKTQAGSAQSTQERYLVNRRLFEHASLPGDLRARESQVVSRMHLGCARVYLKIGSYRESMAELVRAARAWPAMSLRPSFVWHALLAVFGLLVGQGVWLRARAALRRLRQRTADE
jgi:GT2 family glycosyltransferase